MDDGLGEQKRCFINNYGRYPCLYHFKMLNTIAYMFLTHDQTTYISLLEPRCVAGLRLWTMNIRMRSIVTRDFFAHRIMCDTK